MSAPSPVARRTTSARWKPRAFRGRLEVVRRLGWGVVDQGVSSLSNFAVGIVVARSLGPTGFGAFSLAYVTYSMILSATRGLATDPLLVRYSGAPSTAWRKAAGASTATATLTGIAAGAACLGVGLFLGRDVGGAFIALAVVLPGLMLQDSWRFVFFSIGRASKAVLNDVVWGTLQIVALLVLLGTGHATVVWCVLAFGGTAAIAGVFGLLQSRILPRPTRVKGWMVETRALGGRYLAENLSMGGARQLRMTVLGGVTGLAAVGEVRAAEMLMGPFLVILMGASQVAVPEASHVLANAPRRLEQFCLALGAVLAVAAGVWGAALLALSPTGLGDKLLGDVWPGASTLLVPVIIGMAMGCFSVAATAGVRALAAAPRSLRAQLANAALYAIGGGFGAVIDGAQGSCWGVALATTISAGLWWVQLRRAHREHMNSATGLSPGPGTTERVTT
jgi:O-antigen/teichoic acid export membrane protein